MELLAVDDMDNKLLWTFDSKNEVSNAVFQAMRYGKVTEKTTGDAWTPKVLKGSMTTVAQDTVMYREQDGIKSFLLDDDGCDCHSTLSMGHAMCADSCDDTYGNCKIKGGVDKLSDRQETGTAGAGEQCTGPAEDHGLMLYYYHPTAHVDVDSAKDAQKTYGSITVDGTKYEKFWWFSNGAAWPMGKKDVLGDSYGDCKSSDEVCFQKLPEVEEKGLLLLAVDDQGNQFEWKFDSSNEVAHAAFKAFRYGTTTQKASGTEWAPRVIKGSVTKSAQDTLMYRDQDGIRSFMLDDDGCDCHSTLSMGHSMCGDGCSNTYGNCMITGGVDKLSDTHVTGTEGSGSACTGPATDYGLTLYYHAP